MSFRAESRNLAKYEKRLLDSARSDSDKVKQWNSFHKN